MWRVNSIHVISQARVPYVHVTLLFICFLLSIVQSEDKRVLQAAAEVTQRGLAKITLLGDPDEVRMEAKKLGIDISLCNVVKPVVSLGTLSLGMIGRGAR